jgi:hypothetical protein
MGSAQNCRSFGREVLTHRLDREDGVIVYLSCMATVQSSRLHVNGETHARGYPSTPVPRLTSGVIDPCYAV